MLTRSPSKNIASRSRAAACGVSLGLVVGCGGSDRSAITTGNPDAPGVAASTEPPSEGAAPSAPSRLIVVTERESPEAALQYLHVLEGWPDSGELDYSAAIELGEFVSVYSMGDAVFVHQPDDALVRKLTIGADGAVADDQALSFAAYGLTGSSGDMVYVSPERAYFVDEGAGQIISWNPRAMQVLGSAPIAEQALSRGALPAQISRGIALEGEAFVSASWRDWDTLTYHDAAAVGLFDAAATAPELRIIEDERCASNVTTPFDGGDGFVYIVSDAALGFDALANPNRTAKALCVLRLRPGAGEFDPDFFVDLGRALGSPGFYAAHPMRGGKLLVNLWAPDVDVASVATPDDSGWYWDFPPYFEYAVVDLASGSSIPVSGIPRAAVQWSITLQVDGETFVQTYRDDRGSDLQRVDVDGSVMNVLSNPMGADVQYLGRVGAP